MEQLQAFKTDWSPIRSVIIRVINKISDLFNQAGMITDRIGRHEVVLLINRNRYNFPENRYIILGVRAFNTECPKLGKISPAKILCLMLQIRPYPSLVG